MKHYTKEDLELYRNGQMSVLGRISCSAHLQSCAECMKMMEELKADDKLVSALRNSVQQYQELSQEEPIKTK
jgi:anti-sigma factor ChrR (cupin superfamily)